MTRIVAAFAVAFLLMGMGFGVKEYDSFHDLLHPLEHEAVPKNDFARIRKEAKELTKRGDAIIKLGVPKGIKAEKTEEFKKHMNDFTAALAKFSSDAESGTDADLKASFDAVHDSFEEMAHMLPRN